MVLATLLCSSTLPHVRISAFGFQACHGLGSKAVCRAPSTAQRMEFVANRGIICSSGRFDSVVCKAQKNVDETPSSLNVKQLSLWALEGVYVGWLFFLPFAPGDPVWAISSDTVRDLLGLSLNFFFILPFVNSVGVHVMEAPVLHPMSEGLFNFVIGWTFMFAPLLFTDCRKDRYRGSLDILWGLQMFLTNAFLIPYMAIRLNDNSTNASAKQSKLGMFMSTRGAPYVGLLGGAICFVSAWWAVFGRADGSFGGLAERLEFLRSYIGSERLAYAFIWDIGLYTIFQPWLIGDNLQNVQENKVELVTSLRYLPVFGLIGYCLFLDRD
ncbi:hypothetical protein H6P81_002775 [Aristolochia fimbriata]|uniref:Uncharacterized protein n=1 Tax=Aristolochia fimbriata TaxID=158543 RepID=A0AAV7FET9_ARIFI|nr:hypothetical protein H6P81_002775 [Aristolochia fimbriata]